MDTKEKEKFTNDKWPCKKCGTKDVWYTSDTTYDEAYDRYHYHCHKCGYRWSVVAETD